MKKFILGLIIGIAVATASSVYANEISSVIGKTVDAVYTVTVDGNQISDAVSIDGISYLPVRDFANQVDYSVYFNGETGDIILNNNQPMIVESPPDVSEKDIKQDDEKEYVPTTAPTEDEDEAEDDLEGDLDEVPSVSVNPNWETVDTKNMTEQEFNDMLAGDDETIKILVPEGLITVKINPNYDRAEQQEIANQIIFKQQDINATEKKISDLYKSLSEAESFFNQNKEIFGGVWEESTSYKDLSSQISDAESELNQLQVELNALQQ